MRNVLLLLLLGCAGDKGTGSTPYVDPRPTPDTPPVTTTPPIDTAGDDSGGPGDTATPIDCSQPDMDAFLIAYVERYCRKWDACNTGGLPCPAGTPATGYTCTYDPAVGDACLCGSWTCGGGEGQEFPVPPPACDYVCS